MENNINKIDYNRDPLEIDEIKFEDDDSGQILELQNAQIFERPSEPQNNDYIILSTVEETSPGLIYDKYSISENTNNNDSDSVNLNNNESLSQSDMKNKNQPKKRDEVKRMTHNEVERRRRDKINTWLLKLKELLPSDELNDNLLVQTVSPESIKKNNSKKAVKSNSLSSAKNDSKCGIIQRACDYIREMQTELNELKQCLTDNNTSLQIENSVLKKENQLLKKELNPEENQLLKKELNPET